MKFLAADTPNPVLPIWQELVLGLIAFGVLYFVLWKYVFPRMEQTFKARVDAIEGGIKRAEERQAEANQLFEQYKQQLAEARNEASVIRDRARGDADAIREDAQRQAREERDRIIASGQEQLEQQRATLVRELRAEMGELAVDLASRIVGEALADEARRRGTVERFLTELETAS
jgi:F-type H+-transporting ATPase subunit b